MRAIIPGDSVCFAPAIVSPNLPSSCKLSDSANLRCIVGWKLEAIDVRRIIGVLLIFAVNPPAG
jgi:hypothetical protein